MPAQRTRNPKRHARRGFTLVEAALATAVLGVGVLALIEAQGAFIRTNLYSSQATSGALMAGEIRELTRNLPKHDPVTGLSLADVGGGATQLIGWGPEGDEQNAEDIDDIDDLDGMVFLFSGTPGMLDADLPGPIDGAGRIIPEIAADGTQVFVAGNPKPIEGWVQRVSVEKVDPFDTSVAVQDDASIPPGGGNPGRAVDEYPLRVTVDVEHTEPGKATERIARLVWIVP
ncbi:MAG: prepilin-type N-terminal cleavage/methylation domain-containing protein [Planctomycetota bacterium]